MKINVLMDGDKVCIAWFKKKIKKFTLTTGVEPADGGTVTGAGTYKEGTIVPVEAIPNSDFEFDYWEGTGKWHGLGMVGFWNQVDEFLTTWIENGFIDLRLDIPDYQYAPVVEQSKAHVIKAVAAGARVIWGVSSNSSNNSAYTITAANWSLFRQAILDAAQWAQDNGVYEFQIGNEEESHNDDTTLTDAQLRDNLKSLATGVKAIFTNGNVSYSCRALDVDDWISLGKGDIDILAANIYRGQPTDITWKILITNLVNEFGIDGTYITEFNLNPVSLDDYSTDEIVQAEALTEMIDYIKASGMKRAIYFVWYNSNSRHGVIRADGTYKPLWNSLINSN